MIYKGSRSCKVIAIHGGPDLLASPGMLKRDMGSPSWVDVYWDGHDPEEIAEYISLTLEPVILIGYSKAGEVISQVTHLVELSRIAASVLYEAPPIRTSPDFYPEVFPEEGLVNFPVLQLWNDRGVYFSRCERRRRIARQSFELWSRGRRIVHQWEPYRGRHTKRFLGILPMGHAWKADDLDIQLWLEEWAMASAWKKIKTYQERA